MALRWQLDLLDRNIDLLDSLFLMNDGLLSSFNYAGSLNPKL